jgi:hypothetical protein
MYQPLTGLLRPLEAPDWLAPARDPFEPAPPLNPWAAPFDGPPLLWLAALPSIDSQLATDPVDQVWRREGRRFGRMG